MQIIISNHSITRYLYFLYKQGKRQNTRYLSRRPPMLIKACDVIRKQPFQKLLFKHWVATVLTSIADSISMQNKLHGWRITVSNITVVKKGMTENTSRQKETLYGWGASFFMFNICFLSVKWIGEYQNLARGDKMKTYIRTRSDRTTAGEVDVGTSCFPLIFVIVITSLLLYVFILNISWTRSLSTLFFTSFFFSCLSIFFQMKKTNRRKRLCITVSLFLVLLVSTCS